MKLHMVSKEKLKLKNKDTISDEQIHGKSMVTR